MAHVLMSTVPAHGHVNPALPVAAELVRRGNRVHWHTGSEFASAVTATGALFVPTRHTPPHEPAPMHDQTGHSADAIAAAVRRMFVDPALGQLVDFREVVDRAPIDVVLTDSIGLGALLLHDQGGPPWATLGITALHLSGTAAPPFKSGLRHVDASNDQATARAREHWAALYANVRDVTELFNAQRAEVGLGPLPDGQQVTDVLMSPYLHVQSGTPAFDYPHGELPPQIHFVGPLMLPPPKEYPLPGWWAELEGGRPVVHVTQGTIAHDPASLVQPALTGLAHDDLLVVVTTPEPDALGPLPANARAARFVPHSLLLPQVDVMITNGGYGGVLTALSYGVPLVASGRHADKPEVCARVAWVGAGIDLATDSPTPERVADAVRTVLSDPSYRDSASRIRADFARHDPPREAADLLERLAASGRPVVAAGASPR